jgi:hypothetical protein
LPEYTAFLQGKPWDHIDSSSDEKARKKLINYLSEPMEFGFKYISQHMIKVMAHELYDYTSGIPSTPLSLGKPKDINDLVDI